MAYRLLSQMSHALLKADVVVPEGLTLDYSFFGVLGRISNFGVISGMVCGGGLGTVCRMPFWCAVLNLAYCCKSIPKKG